MGTDFIIVSEYCLKTDLDLSFILSLEENGLIEIYTEKGERCFSITQLPDIEKYTRMYYDLSINIEGIDAIQHLLGRMKELQNEVECLRNKLRIYETNGV